MEIVGLRKKIEKSKDYVKFNESSVVLDEILKCQRISSDKSGLGFKKEEDKLKEVLGSPRTPEVESSEVVHAPAHANKEVENSKVPHEDTPTHQIHSIERKRTTPRWSQSSRYENRFNGYCYSCHNSKKEKIPRIWIAHSKEEKNTGSQSDQIRCWACDKVGHVATRCHTLRCFTCGVVCIKTKYV